MTVLQVILKIVIPLGVDIYFMFAFYFHYSAQPPAQLLEGYLLFYLQGALIYFTIPFLYLIKVADRLHYIADRDIAMFHGKLFYGVIYSLIVIVSILTIVDKLFI